MKGIAQALHLTAVFVLAMILIPLPLPTATGQEEGAGGSVWSRYFRGEGHGVVVDASGVYLGGALFEDGFLLKYDADGQQLWTRELGAIAEHVKVAMNASTLYVFGRTLGADIFLRALDTDGLALWNHRFGTEWGEDPVGVAADASGVYVVGNVRDRFTKDPAADFSFIQKYDMDGHEMWARRLGSLTNSVSGVALDASGVYVGGKVGIEFFAVWKFDLDGRYAWARQFKVGGGAPTVAADSSGVYVVGTTGGALPNQTSSGAADAFVRKYSSDGYELWTRQFGAPPGSHGTPAVDNAHAVAVTEHGVYVGGTVRIGGGRTDAFIQKFDASGGELWGLQYRFSSCSFRRLPCSPVGAVDLAVGDTGIYLTRHPDQASWGYLVRFGETPGPPRDLQPTPGEAHVSVAWASPRSDGGLPIEGYRIYRGTNPASLELVGVVEEATLQTYLDTEVTNQVTYYYAVSAVNEIGEGDRSPIVATTPGTPPAVANPGPPPIDPVFFGLLAILGAALILAIYRLRGARAPGRDPVEGRFAHRPDY